MTRLADKIESPVEEDTVERLLSGLSHYVDDRDSTLRYFARRAAALRAREEVA